MESEPTRAGMSDERRTLRGDLRRVSELLRPEAARYALGMLSLTVVNVTDVVAPLFLAVAVDLTVASLGGAAVETPGLLRTLGVNAAEMTIFGAAVAYLGLHVMTNAARYPMLMFTAVPSHAIGQHIRNALTQHFLRLSRPFYDRARSGDLMSLATNDVHAARMMLGPGILVGGDALLVIAAVIVVLLTLSWELTLVAMAPLPFIGIVTNVLSHAEYKRFEAVQEDLASLTERARESYAGIRIIQGFAREAFDRGRFEGYSRTHFEKNLALAKVRALFGPTLDLMFGSSTALVLLFGGRMVVNDTLSIGTFLAFLFLVRYLSGPMIGFGWAVSLLQRGRASLRRIDAQLSEPVEIFDAPGARDARGVGALEVRNLTFAYAGPAPVIGAEGPETGDGAKLASSDGAAAASNATKDTVAPLPALRDVSFSLSAGKTLGLIGPVGSGKSTLARLLVRLYEPPAGSVFVDGDDVRELTLGSLRETIVLAPQDTFLFSDTVARNIAMAGDIQADAAPEYAKLAHLHGELLELSEGYETMLGERGVNLSGGQRQRLAIARTIAADPRVMVLDDCLSAVDAKTEEAILGTLRKVFEGRTGIIISHRVCAVQDCDEILVLEGGQVTERGAHAELLAAGGYYARIAAEQGREDAT